ncbi:ATP-dependent RNA helicase DbpA [Candidatus Methanoperedenaceae archaeon GB50]|nr:ATP-dependent RNA helicase DbpA [Candidatus Methanoperedenaceae archaeon GB50]
MEYITHPLVKPETVEKRVYQLNLAATALQESTLVVLPTGLGKTIVALLVMVQRLESGKVLLLSPTKPLVEQHAGFLKKVLKISEDEIVAFTGSIPPKEREMLWSDARVIVSTPQVIENDLLSGRITLRDVAHITFDEAHRATGNYAYVYIAKRYFEEGMDPLVLGITASPGSSRERIEEVCTNLGITHLEMRSEYDPEIAPYVFNRRIEWKIVKIPLEMKGLKDLLESVLEEKMQKLAELGVIMAKQKKLTKTELLGVQKQLQRELQRYPQRQTYQAVSIVAEIFKITHAIELGETQGPQALIRYFERLDHEASSKGGSKASKRLMDDVRIRRAVHTLKKIDTTYPKIDAVKEVVAEEVLRNPDSRVIVFTNYRDTSELVTNALNDVEGVRAVRFVGQASKYRDTGLTQRQQREIIEAFKEGEYNTLVATSVAEEGLDIPSTDLIVFYEPVPSEIRSIQRKGRTGRKHEGRIVVLMARGSKDEAYYWSTDNKEREMQKRIGEMRKSLGEIKPRQTTTREAPQRQLLEFTEPEDQNHPQIYIDHREIRSPVARELERLGAQIKLERLEVGDYTLSDRVCIERKTTGDLLSTVTDEGRNLFTQLSDLTRNYERPLLIIEGDNLYTERRIHPNAIRGLLATITVDFHIPIISTTSPEETAAIIYTIAKREQRGKKRSPTQHGRKTCQTLREQQEYVISSISNIGPVAARRLLQHFKSIRAIVSASEDELTEVEGIGKRTAERIIEVTQSQYKG